MFLRAKLWSKSEMNLKNADIEIFFLFFAHDAHLWDRVEGFHQRYYSANIQRGCGTNELATSSSIDYSEEYYLTTFFCPSMM